MKLLDLPPEILEMIASKIDTQSGLNAFLQTNRYLYQSFHLYLYSNQILIDKAHKVLQFTAQKRWEPWLVYGQIEEYVLEAAVWLRENPGRRFMDPEKHKPAKNVDAQAKDHWPSLAWAALKGHEEAVKFFLRLEDKDVSMLPELDVDARDPASRTPLSYAAEQGQVNIVRLLLAAGADPNEQDSHFARTPLHWAGSPRLTGRAPSKPFEKQFPASKFEKCFCSVETYFKEDVPGFGPWNEQQGKECDFVFDIESQQFTASLHNLPPPWSNDTTYEQIVTLLLEYGAEMEARDSERRTPLCWAAACGYTSFVEILLRKGAEVTYRDIPGLRDPVSWAAEHGHTDTIKLLIRSGAAATASPLVRESCSMTLAAMNGHDETLTLLINNFYYREFFGNMNIYLWPMVWAARKGHKSTVQLLLDLSARHYPDRPINSVAIFWASYHGHTDIVRLMLDAGMSPETTCRWDKMTPLQAAVMNRHVSTVKLLLETGKCGVNTVDFHGRTAFHWVTKDRELAHLYRWGQSTVIESQRVREVYEKDNENYKKIQQLLFEHRADQSCQAIKKLLLQHGADASLKKPKPKPNSVDPPHTILKIHRPRDAFPVGTIPVSLR